MSFRYRTGIVSLLSIAMLLNLLTACKQNTKQAKATNTGSDNQLNTTVTTADTAGYKVFQVINNCLEGSNQPVSVSILQDTHLTGLAAQMNYYPEYHAAGLTFKSDEELFNPDGPALKTAILLLKRQDGSEIKRYVLDVSCARIDTAYLDEHKTKLIYILTLDYSTGMGSYNGPLSSFVKFTDTGMVNYNADNGFATTLKSAWSIRYTNNNLEVFSKICRPCGKDEFCITMRKATWQTDSFKNETIVKKGFWENEESEDAKNLTSLFDSFSE